VSEFNAKTICVLGRQPALGLAELESLYGADQVEPLAGAALLNIEPENIDFKRLGGTIKTARILATLPYTDWKSVNKYLLTKIPEHLQTAPEGKFTLGISVYGLSVSLNDLNKSNLGLKKVIKASGRPVRIVPNMNLELNSAQVLHNKLTHRGAWELLLISNAQETILAQTLFVQDIDAYAARDQVRPKRDARVGMLPPKLAQILVNLATGLPEQELELDSTADRARIRVLDPFCGTGVVLQEALLMGYSVIGTDLDQRMVEYTQENLRWLVEKYPLVAGQVSVEAGDATNFVWPGFSVVATETYLGRPLTTLPERSKLNEIVRDVNTITAKFLRNLSGQMKTGQKAAIAVPAWRTGNTFLHLPVVDQLTDMGYNYLDLKHVRRQELIYFRENQVVARQLIILEKV